MLDNKEAMRCPGCQVILMKNGGCRYIRCSMCHTPICWRCKERIGDFENKIGGCNCATLYPLPHLEGKPRTYADPSNAYYTPFGANRIPGKRKQSRKTKSKKMKVNTSKPSTTPLSKKNVFVSSDWGPGDQHVSMARV